MKEKTKFSKSKEVSKHLFLVSRSMSQLSNPNTGLPHLMSVYLFFPTCYYYSHKNTKGAKAKIEGYKIYWPIEIGRFTNIKYLAYPRIEAYRLYDKIFLDKSNTENKK